MIDTKKKFKNCYIDLSNKELNGEVTEEIYDSLQQSMNAIGFDDWDRVNGDYPYVYKKKHFKQIIVSDDAVCSTDCLQWLRNKTKLRNHEKYKSYKEVSIYDIAGMGDKPMAYITTHAELLKLHGKKVTCRIDGEFIDNAKICVNKVGDDEQICLCQNMFTNKVFTMAEVMFGHSGSILLSRKTDYLEDKAEYESNNNRITELQLVEETPKPKTYTIEDLKTEKIAVHLPTKEEWDRAIIFFEKNGIEWQTSFKTISKSFEGCGSYEPFNYVSIWKYNSKLIRENEAVAKEKGYTIITLDDLDMEVFEPTAEEKEYWIEYQEGVAKIRLDLMNKVIIKLGDEEKVITRDDFEEEIDIKKHVNVDLCFGLDRQIKINDSGRELLITEDSFDEIYNYLENKDSGYAKENYVFKNLLDYAEKTLGNINTVSPKELTETISDYLEIE